MKQKGCKYIATLIRDATIPGSDGSCSTSVASRDPWKIVLLNEVLFVVRIADIWRSTSSSEKCAFGSWSFCSNGTKYWPDTMTVLFCFREGKQGKQEEKRRAAPTTISHNLPVLD
jgi:hypothetical protein